MRTDTVFFSGFNRNIVYLVGLNAQDNFNVIDLGKPDDIARAIVFFLDPANNWITGQVLGVDGGLSRISPKIRG